MSNPASFIVRGEIEHPRPLRAPADQVALTGWCLLENQPVPPPVRLTTTAGVLPLTARTDRTDVPRLLPGQPAAAKCGFTLTGRLPPGVYLANFEAQLPDRSWQIFKTLSLVVTPVRLFAAIESPVASGTVSLRTHLEGWALHPTQPITALALRYGHQEIPCTLGGRRPDVPRLHPDRPDAAHSGFTSQTILSAGHGPLRLKARLRDGSVVIAPTALTIAVRSDENVGPEVQLDQPRLPLPGYGAETDSSPVTPATRSLNLLFVLHGDFTSNSTLQAAALVNELSLAGHVCALAVPRDLATFSYQKNPRFTPLLHADAVAHGGNFPNGRGPDLIHAWTTRERVRQTALDVQRSHGGRLVVQLEDNEQELLAHNLQRPWSELRALPAAEIDRLVPPDYSHPLRGAEFLGHADGVTVIIDALRRFVPAGKPCATVWPAADRRYFYPRPSPKEFRRALRLAPATTILFYPGNAHAANAGEMLALHAAVLQLNRTGHPTVLIRAGIDQVDFLGPLAGDVRPYVLSLGAIHTHRHLPPLMALADIFVQPGAADPFNDCRFPSKLPEFFSLGRPVVLPRTNLGTTVRHGLDAYVLDPADAAGITRAVVDLRQDRALAERLSLGAVEFARKNFSWRRSAETLAKFYATLTA